MTRRSADQVNPVDDVVMAVVGAMVPDEPRFHGPAFNRAAQMFQDELVRGLHRAGLPVNAVFSIEPLPSFPRSPRLLGSWGRETAASGLRIRLLPFVNLFALKPLTAGLSTFIALVAWAWRMRHRRRIMHVFNMTMPPGSAVWLAARLTGSRITVSVLDVWKPGSVVPDTWQWHLDFFLLRLLLPRLDGHMVVSPAVRDELIPGLTVCVIEGGIAPVRFRTVGLQAVRSPRTAPFRIVLSGSMEIYNGVELVLDAMPLLPDDVELIVAGAGPLADRVKASVDPRVIFRGFLAFEEVLGLYESADLVLNMRITRTIDTRYFFPSKLMELLASGTPVLSTCTGQVESEYGGLLYLLRDETPEGLAAKILDIRAIDPVVRRDLGARAREFMFREKTWERQGRRLACYMRRQVLGEPSA